MDNLENVIEDSLTDSILPEEPAPVEEPVSQEPPVEAAPEPEPSPEPEVKAEPEAPAEDVTKPVQDDFEKRFGIPAQGPTGRENRIPYSRVKKIAENAEKSTESRVRKEFEGFINPKQYQELETKIKQEYEPKLQDYESRLTQVAEFEQLMTTNQAGFLTLLAQRVPGYAEILAPLFDQGHGAQEPRQAVAQAPQDEMPQPDRELSDGSRVYSLEGLKALREWDRRQVEKAVLTQVEKRFGPIEQSYQSYQRVQAALPQVQAQIAEARQWPLFNESEQEIVVALQKNPTWNLERAYQAVVLPKIQAERDKIAETAKVDKEKVRAEILREMKQTPRSTSAPSTSSKPQSQAVGGNRSMEDIISEAVKAAGLK